MSMQNCALEDHDWQIVKAVIIDPDCALLNEEQKGLLLRITSLARIVDRHPQGKAALAIHQAKYPEISRRTAGTDLMMARELNVSYTTFNYEFWHNWLINDIVDAIQSARSKGDLKAWIGAQSNLIRAIGEKQPEEKDPKLVEKHTFLIQINNHSTSVNIDTKTLKNYKPAELRAISDSIYTEITEEEATDMFKS